MFGYCAIGRVNIATPPTRTMRMAMTIATMGRPTKKRDMDYRTADAEPRGDGAADGPPLSEAGAAKAVAPPDAGTGRTVIPGLRRTRSETITFSPALTPCSMIHIVPTC